MDLAIKEAKKAYNDDEVPVGCVITRNGVVIAKSHNETNAKCNSTCHAEMTAIQKALKKTVNKDLPDCEMYVTLEPCPMCAGAIINAKIKRLYIGAMEPKSGCFGSITDFNKLKFNHKTDVYYGIGEEECANLLKDFFKNKR